MSLITRFELAGKPEAELRLLYRKAVIASPLYNTDQWITATLLPHSKASTSN